jgi:hypothetical protein
MTWPLQLPMSLPFHPSPTPTSNKQQRKIILILHLFLDYNAIGHPSIHYFKYRKLSLNKFVRNNFPSIPLHFPNSKPQTWPSSSLCVSPSLPFHPCLPSSTPQGTRGKYKTCLPPFPLLQRYFLFRMSYFQKKVVYKN